MTLTSKNKKDNGTS